MDKEEYRVRLETIKTLANEGDFTAAASVADTVDWKRVKSVRTLCMIGEIYEASGKYEDTNKVLQYAYWRAQTSKTVLYRLAEVNIRTGHFDEAKRYCDEFDMLSQKDSTRYILRYQLMHAMDAPIEDQIRILEAYRENEFTERWAYELAELYKEAGREEDCIRLCDDMILWFAEGKYVTKAMELKMQLRPLTKEQQRRYDARSSADEEEGLDDGYGFRSTPEEREAVVRSADAVRDKDMQSRFASGLRSVFAGIRSEDRREETEDEINEAVIVPEKKEAPAESGDVKEVRELEPESLRIEKPEADTEKEDAAAEPEPVQLTLDDVAHKPGMTTLDFDALLSETQMNLADAVASGKYTKTIDLPDDSPASTFTEEDRERFGLTSDDESVPAGQLSFADLIGKEEQEAAEAADDAAGAGEMPEDSAPEQEELDPLAKLYGKETDESLGLTRQFNLQEEVAKALAQQQKNAQRTESEEALRKRALEKTLRSAGIVMPEHTEEVSADAQKAAAEEPAAETTPEPVEEMAAEPVSAPQQAAPEVPAEPEDDPLIRNIIEEPETFERIPVEPRNFDDTEKELFTYFTKVPGMREQITMALADVHNHTGDKTSRAGNIMIIGRQGAGKTRLSEAMTLSICHDLGIKAARSARIIAEDFNEKNPAEVISRLMGGFLVIEGAGGLSDDAVENLLRAMEFRTDDLVVFLEDEKADLKDLLSRHPGIEEKFTSTIVIPVFTNDELVSFAKTYSKERGYRLDEMGILALYTMIGDNQSATEPVTVRRVKEMVDKAIDKADTGARKIGRRFSKRAVDKDGRILLREKDFEF